jgi:hypothetical protein
MDNNTVKESWIDKLVDELIDAKDTQASLLKDYTYASSERRELEKANTRLIDTILDNTRLDYDGEELRINSDTAIIYLLKLLYPDEYSERLKELKEEREPERVLAKAKAEVAATEEA